MRECDFVVKGSEGRFFGFVVRGIEVIFLILFGKELRKI
jgi:hypothetical protein